MSLIGIDYETAYRSRKNKNTPGPRHSLRGMTYIEYIRSDLFKVHGVGIKIDHGPTEWINDDIQYALSSLFTKNNTHTAYAHNGMFDFAILSFFYGLQAGRYLCTQAMSRALWPSGKHSLEALTKTLNPDLAKGDELEKFDGLWDLTPEQDQELGDYCINDVDLTYANLGKMVPHYPVAELDLIDLTLRLYVEPRLELNPDRVQRHAARLDVEEARIIKAGGVAKSTLSSNPKFAAWLEKEHGIHVPTKPSPTAKKPYNRSLALAKDDLEFIALQNDYPDLKAVWEARIVANSSGDRARCDTLLNAAQVSHINREGRLPVPLLYYGAGTGRYSGTQKLNLQNLTRGGELRKSIIAPEGYVIVVVDLSNIEARMLAYMARCTTLLEAFAEKRDIYSAFASKIYERKIDRKYRVQDDAGNYLDQAGNITNYDGAHVPDYIEGHVGKTCIAEGSRILTDRGEIPIEHVTRDHRLWDGTEWVTHGGVFDKGYKEVITYEGITATPDHLIPTRSGHALPIGVAASKMERLIPAARSNGTPIRVHPDCVATHPEAQRLSLRAGAMSEQRRREMDKLGQSAGGENNLIPSQRGTPLPLPGPTKALRRCRTTVHQSQSETFRQLWRAWHHLRLQFCPVDGAMDTGASGATPGRDGAGPDRQRSWVHPRKPSLRHAQTAARKSAQYTPSVFSRGLDAATGFRFPLLTRVDLRTGGKGGSHRRTDTRKVRVYDIANAGPRYRYTANGKLVFNCVLGLGYGMGPPKYKDTLAKGALGGPPVYITDADARRTVHELYRKTYPEIPRLWREGDRILSIMSNRKHFVDEKRYNREPEMWCKCRVEYQGLRLPNGLKLDYPQLHWVSNNDEESGHWEYWNGKYMTSVWGGGLVQRCLGADTEVLTQRGWIPITLVTTADRLWDGVEWVNHRGLLDQGTRQCIKLNGVWMTPDHEVWTHEGWQEAAQCTRSNIAKVRAPARHSLRSERRQKSLVVSPLRLWLRENLFGQEPPAQDAQHHALRLSDRQTNIQSANSARPIRSPASPRMGQYAGALLSLQPQVLAPLRRAGDHCMRTLAKSLREFLGRCFTWLPTRPDARPHRYQWSLFPRELPLGHLGGTIQQQAEHYPHQYPTGKDDSRPSVTSVQHRAHHPALPDRPQLAGGSVTDPTRLPQPVYDLANAGPRTRFTVRGTATDDPMIVHNCTQALARIAMTDPMMVLDNELSERYGGMSGIVHTVHDELLALAPTEHAQEVQDRMIERMCQLPPWADDKLVLAAEGGFDKVYSK